MKHACISGQAFSVAHTDLPVKAGMSKDCIAIDSANCHAVYITL